MSSSFLTYRFFFLGNERLLKDDSAILGKRIWNPKNPNESLEFTARIIRFLVGSIIRQVEFKGRWYIMVDNKLFFMTSRLFLFWLIIHLQISAFSLSLNSQLSSPSTSLTTTLRTYKGNHSSWIGYNRPVFSVHLPQNRSLSSHSFLKLEFNYISFVDLGGVLS